MQDDIVYDIDPNPRPFAHKMVNHFLLVTNLCMVFPIESPRDVRLLDTLLVLVVTVAFMDAPCGFGNGIH